MATEASRRVKYTEKCVHGTRPPCSCACPFNLNLRELMRKAAAGSWNAAYRVLANELIFPETAMRLCGSRCAEHCAENIDVPALERACIELATQKEPMRFSVAPKKATVAIVGAGISGLACALRLAARGFPVTVLDAGAEIGGTLAQAVCKELYMPEIARQFKYAPYTLVPAKTIETADALLEYDAVYIATGRGGADFGLLRGWNAKSMATERRGWFLGGELTGVCKAEALAQGRVASTSIEKYLLLSGSMSGDEGSFIQRECLYTLKNSGATGEPHERGFSRESAQAEAKRCRMCDCTLCYDECAFMRGIRLDPRTIEEATVAALTPDGLEEQQGSRMVFSCEACGHCGSVCPQGVSLEKLLLNAKLELKRMGKYPQELHDYYLRDMENANGENRLLLLSNGESAKYLFFPGCQAAESGAEHVRAAYAFLKERFADTALLLACCGIPALWAGQRERFEEALSALKADWESAGRPVLVSMCATCMKTLAEYAPEVECVSLYELLDKLGAEPMRSAYGESRAVFDPCSSRELPAMQQAVRRLATRGGMKLTELKSSREQAACCGMSGHVYPANETVVNETAKRAAALSSAEYVAYCENCRNMFLARGKRCRHILDDVFGIEPRAEAPHIEELLRNRYELRCELAGEPPAPPEPTNIRISPELLKKLDSRLISAADVRAVVRYCEESGNRLLTDAGTHIGYKKIGYFTIWAEYRETNEELELINAYGHKLTIGAAL